MEPGDTGQIKVSFNSNRKFGKIKKVLSVYTNDASAPQTKIFIMAHVLPKEESSGFFKKGDVHEGMDILNANLFEGACANCHVKPGVGRYGSTLFNAGCAMCHGQGGKGVKDITEPLNDPAYLSMISDKELYHQIAVGSGFILMHRFSEEVGGPLARAQIESLVSYIRTFQASSF